MEYNQLVAVSGLPGLFELVSSKADGGIVRSLEDSSTRFVSTRVHQFSHLESIEVYTIRENVNLVEVFKTMEKASISLPTRHLLHTRLRHRHLQLTLRSAWQSHQRLV